MKINLLHNCFVFDETLAPLASFLKMNGHEVNHITEFICDDSDITFSTGFLNIYHSFDEEEVKKYKGRIIHWYIELLPVGSGQEHLSHMRSDQFNTVTQFFDNIFVHDPRQSKWMQDVLGITPDGVMTCCPNPDLHQKMNIDKKYDILFYGNPSGRRDALRARIEQMAQEHHLSVMWHGPLLKGQNKIRMINSAKVVLNIHSDDTDSMEDFRVCECLGSGAFMLTETFGWYPSDKLKDGRDFVSCSYDEIPDKILYYLKNTAERRRVADTGYRNIWKNFGWGEEWTKIWANVDRAKNLIRTEESKFLDGRNYFFIIGPQRSGTTLTELILDSHPKVAVFGEPGSYEKISNRNPEPMDHVLGFKIPMWTHRWKYFQKEFPNAKYLFMIRDVRSIAASILTMPRWIESELHTEMENCLPCISNPNLRIKLRQDYESFKREKNWTLLTAVCARTKQCLLQEFQNSDLNVLGIIYEDLVRKPEETIRGVLAFLGLEWDPQVLNHPSVHHGVYMGSTDSQRPIDQSSIDKWKKILSNKEIKDLEGYLLQESWNPTDLCRICGSHETKPYEKYPHYVICQSCGFYRQKKLPEKTYEGPEENFGQGPGTGHLMSDSDMEANRRLAEALYERLQPKSVLDVGCKYPYFLSVLKDRATVLGIDAIDEVVEYGKELGVHTLKVDIENLAEKDSTRWDLITLVHVLEHFHTPVKSFKKLMERLSDQGTIFVRTPNPEVDGIESDLTEHHLTIHPHLFTRRSLQWMATNLGAEIIQQKDYPGSGQSDYLIRRKQKKRTLSVCMIVKNEEKNVEDCLRSVKSIADEIIVVDTGSTDNTKEVVQKYTDKVFDFEWCDDFSAARNFSLEKASCDFILWADADDILEAPGKIPLALKEGYDAYNFNILYGNDIFTHVRLFRNRKGVHFEGRVHEVPIIDGLSFKAKTDLNVIHKTQKHTTEDRTERNLRILQKSLEEKPSNTRTMFYLANTLREAGRIQESFEMYNRYLKVSDWKDERWMALKFQAQIRMSQKDYHTAIKILLRAIAEDDRWVESYYYLGECYFLLGEYQKCINWMNTAVNTPDHDSTMFKETRVYQDLPYRYLAAAYETLGDAKEALNYTQEALKRCPGDGWLQDRVEHFQNILGSSVKPGDTGIVIECYRQGALGDCIMTTAALRGLKEKYPGCWIRYITHKSSIPVLEGNKYIDQLMTESPHNGTHLKDVNLQVYFCYPDKDSTLRDEGYPEKPLNRHLVEIFNECAGVPDAGMETEITLTSKEDDVGFELKEDHGHYISLQVRAGWSPYKEWGTKNWEEVVGALKKEGYPIVQIGGEEEDLIPGAIDQRGRPLRESLSIIKNAMLHLGIDSIGNHAAHAFGVPAVILFGSTSPAGSGYRENINIWRGLECSPCYKEYEWAKEPRGECPYNKACMTNITTKEVIESVLSKLG